MSPLEGQHEGRRGDLFPHNVHFSPNTLDVLKIHAFATNSGGVSALVRTIVECYLSDAVDFSDPRYEDVTPVARPKERYRGHHKKLGLA